MGPTGGAMPQIRLTFNLMAKKTFTTFYVVLGLLMILPLICVVCGFLFDTRIYIFIGLGLLILRLLVMVIIFNIINELLDS